MSNLAIPNREQVRDKLARFPRTAVAYLPTPLTRMENLSRKVGANIFIKRDDMTGLALGGNKSRKLAFIMADAASKGATSIITWAGVQSNWCRQVAAAARQLSIKPVLVLFKRKGLPSDVDGNLLLDDILGAEIHLEEVASNEKIMDIDVVRPILDEIAAQERSAGRVPYIAPGGGSQTQGSMTKPLGAIAYANAMLEILDQADAQKLEVDYVVLPSGTGSTHAGLLAGAKLLSPGAKIVGISVGENNQTMAGWVSGIGSECLHALASNARIAENEVVSRDEYFGEGYGLLNPETVKAMRMVAEAEGILLDPVYTGKAMAGLLDLAKRDYFEREKNIVFVHTGGTPLLFPYRNEIAR